ncbi:MAG TPA: sulfite exporter TauE/SafE family protein [Xanthobacteraceae bacterium]|nr:sulfite exporter TauE/SafE family protein [Xanthobacteraceae bacterium]
MPVEVLALIVFAGAFVQSATGIGFGVISGPFLLHAYGYDRAIAETAVFSLVVAVVSAAGQSSAAEPRATAGLAATLPVGVAAGLAILWAVPRSAVVSLFGLMLGTLGLVLLLQRQGTTNAAAVATQPFRFSLETASAGILAGACAALFAAPGPAAAWGLARTQMNGPTLRGTMAVYFVIAYAAILVAFAFSGLLAGTDWKALGFLALVCIVGAVAGIAFGDRMSGTILHRAIALIITASGLSILLSLGRTAW